jgi:dolichol-phosphate mannosyltransferase
MQAGAVSRQSAICFSLVGGVGCAVGYAWYLALLAAGVNTSIAQTSGFLCVTILTYALNSRLSFSYLPGPSTGAEWQIYGRYLAACLMALFLIDGITQLAESGWDLPRWCVIFLNIAVGAAGGYLGSAFYVFPPVRHRISEKVRWRVLAVGLAIYAVLLRLLYMRLVNLMPEEAYYWNYAQHLDFGYLDHPPAVAWLIRLSTQILGNNEFAVRATALALWFVTVAFCFQLTRNLYGKTAAFASIFLLSAMPFFSRRDF